MSQVFDENTLESFAGHLAVGHCRYSTTGASHVGRTRSRPSGATEDGSIALGHNGNLINTAALAEMVQGLPSDDGELDIHARNLEASTNDTSLVTALLAHHPDKSLEADAPSSCSRRSRAPSAFVFMNENTLYAARDPEGIRPLVLGRLDRGWVVAQRGRRARDHRRERGPRGRAGRAARDRRGRPALPQRFAEPTPQGLRVRVRLPRPPRRDHRRSQRPRGAGRDGPPAGARKFPVDADLVIPVPESGTPAAVRLRARESGIPFGQGFVKNAYVGPDLHPAQPDPAPARHPAQAQRPRARDPRQADRRRRRLDRARQHPARPWSGCSARRGPLEVHVRISSPPVKWPCFYGIDFATRAELIANGARPSTRSPPGDRRRHASATSPSTG